MIAVGQKLMKDLDDLRWVRAELDRLFTYRHEFDDEEWERYNSTVKFYEYSKGLVERDLAYFFYMTQPLTTQLQ